MPNGVDFIVSDRVIGVCSYCWGSIFTGTKVITFGMDNICPDCAREIVALAKKHDLVPMYTCKKCGTYKDDNHGRFLVHTRNCKGEAEVQE